MVVKGSKEWVVQCFSQVLQVDLMASYFSQAGEERESGQEWVKTQAGRGVEFDLGLVKNQVELGVESDQEWAKTQAEEGKSGQGLAKNQAGLGVESDQGLAFQVWSKGQVCSHFHFLRKSPVKYN